MKTKTPAQKPSSKINVNSSILPKTSAQKNYRAKVIDSTSRSLRKPSSEREQLKEVLSMVKAIRSGDFSDRLALEENDSVVADIAEALNDINEMNLYMANEFVRVGKLVGKEGKMTERLSLATVKGASHTSIESVNTLITDLVQPTTEAARVITAVAKGDLSQKITVDAKGDILELKLFQDTP